MQNVQSPTITRLRALIALVLVALSFSCNTAHAVFEGVANENRARVNYMLNCQGCHGAEAQGSVSASVPRMQNFVGNFLKVQGGREYLVQVPGSANATVNDAELAELLNWLIPTISGAELPINYMPYTETEITALRYTPEEDVIGTREKLIDLINALPDE